MSDAIKKLPWLTSIAVLLWYTIYGWALSMLSSPLLSWGIASAIAAFLAAAINIAWLLAVPATLAVTWLVGLPLALNTAVVKGNEQVENIANVLGSGIGFLGSTFLLAAFWFSPLFWAKWQMTKNGFHRNQIFWAITFSSWLGLGLGWVIGRWQ
ncbi:MAG: hypothetical protein HC770_00975 [Pseudanabaena sp. CRU_2_10]|nr:hypothetical protein [Pseudanabaena sp. CRU_2_10]